MEWLSYFIYFQVVMQGKTGLKRGTLFAAGISVILLGPGDVSEMIFSVIDVLVLFAAPPLLEKVTCHKEQL